MNLKPHHYFYLLTAALFLCFFGYNLFSEGMFMDGTLYASISRNLAQGLGSFWKPHLTDYLLPEFYEHPPLAFGLQSLWFSLFGDSILIERFYSLATFVLVAIIMTKLWTQMGNTLKSGWIPLVFWLCASQVLWAIPNNILENTMSIFVCLALLLYMRGQAKGQAVWILGSGGALALGLMTKGPFCLYLWTAPFFAWLVIRKTKVLVMVRDSLLLISSTLLPIAGLYFLFPEAAVNMDRYIELQVIRSIESVQTVDNRLYILIEFSKSMIAPLALAFILFAFKKRKGIHAAVAVDPERRRKSIWLLAIAMMGILPIMISMKQRSFYILTVYPICALGIAHWIYPNINPIIETIKANTKSFLRLRAISLSVLVIGLSLSLWSSTQVGRDQSKIRDVKKVIHLIGDGQSLGVCPSLRSDWNLHGYFSRYGHISLDSQNGLEHHYFLSKETCYSEELKKDFELLDIDLRGYKMYQRK